MKTLITLVLIFTAIHSQALARTRQIPLEECINIRNSLETLGYHSINKDLYENAFRQVRLHCDSKASYVVSRTKSINKGPNG